SWVETVVHPGPFRGRRVVYGASLRCGFDGQIVGVLRVELLTRFGVLNTPAGGGMWAAARRAYFRVCLVQLGGAGTPCALLRTAPVKQPAPTAPNFPSSPRGARLPPRPTCLPPAGCIG